MEERVSDTKNRTACEEEQTELIDKICKLERENNELKTLVTEMIEAAAQTDKENQEVIRVYREKCTGYEQIIEKFIRMNKKC